MSPMIYDIVVILGRISIPNPAKTTNNGSPGACTCRSTCKSKTCPCVSAGISCSDKCHIGRTGVPTQHASTCVNKDLAVIPQQDGSIQLPLNSKVMITYNKQSIGNGTVTAYDAAAHKPYTVHITDLSAKSNRKIFESGKSYSFTMSQLSLLD